MRRVKALTFSTQFLRGKGLDGKLLMKMFEALPRDFKIIGFWEGFSEMTSTWLVESSEFPEVSDSSVLSKIELEFTEDKDGYIQCEVLNE